MRIGTVAIGIYTFIPILVGLGRYLLGDDAREGVFPRRLIKMSMKYQRTLCMRYFIHVP